MVANKPERVAPSRQDIFQGKIGSNAMTWEIVVCSVLAASAVERPAHLFCLLGSVSPGLEQLAAIAEFKNLGPLFKSSEPVQLTEAETEYFVRCIKHVFSSHIVFQVKHLRCSQSG